MKGVTEAPLCRMDRRKHKGEIMHTLNFVLQSAVDYTSLTVGGMSFHPNL